MKKKIPHSIKRALVTSMLLIVAGCGGALSPEVNATDKSGSPYPETRIEEVTDRLHGTSIVDPYRWLEDDESEEVKSWQARQTAIARRFLDSTPDRKKVLDRIAELYRVDEGGVPAHRGEHYFQKRRLADQDQPVLWVSKGFPGKQRVLIDPNTLGKDSTLTLDWYYPSWDGELVVFGLSSSGSERSTLYVMRTENGERLAEEIPNTRHSYVAWLADASGFYYTRRPDPKSDETYFNRIYLHKLGEPWDSDPVVFGTDSPDDAIHLPQLSPDGKHLVITVFRGAGGTEADLYYKRLGAKDKEFHKVAVGKDAVFLPDVKNDKIVTLTNYKASRYRVIEIDYNSPDEEKWREIIPQGEDTIDQILVVKDHIIVKVMRHAVSHLFLHSSSGARISEISLPALGTVGGLRGRFEDEEFFYGFTSFFYAGDVYRYILKKGAADRVSRVDVPVDPDKYTVEQVFYESKDGTRVPMFVARLKDIDTNEPRPVLLTAYGGFNVAITPYFFGKFLPFIEAGGIAAVPNLRGGSEYGEDWHRAGMLDKKQNVFDDFIGAAEHLIETGVTTADKIAIRGGSNGGLLVGAAMTQRPELFKAVICAVPLLDMLRYHKFLIAKLWIPEYGSADDAEQFNYLKAYSPYHNVEQGRAYPATLFLTAESDSRVAPLHARKMAALLQSASTGSEPILLHVETKAGHGKGKPITKKIEEATDVIAFAMERVGLLPSAEWPPE
ncbi:MAG: S9 family peptidase [Deltaproteobacteria bacterium]|nr:S9 family peptidase [Deltaproteobacteria bacterium]